jgi:N-acetylglucosamine kinase-like BadF-type ATPase
VFVFARSGTNWAQQGPELFPNDVIGEEIFGSSVALSDDGNIALVGGSQDNEGVGAAWLFNRSGSTWTQQGPKLKGAGEIGRGEFGAKVALSSDGKVALIGGPENNHGVGAAWAFVNVGSPKSRGKAHSKRTAG